MDAKRIISALEKPEKFQIQSFETITSTNSYLHKLAKSDAPEWTVAVSEQQTSGRGRHLRHWESEANLGLWFSILLKPDMPGQYLNLVNLYAAAVLAEFLESVAIVDHQTTLNIQLKWPNDLLINNCKLCGMLLESSFSADRLQYLVIGIGLNVNHLPYHFSEKIRRESVSLRIASGAQWDREQLLAGFLNRFHAAFDNFYPAKLDRAVDLYCAKVAYLGERLTIRQADDTVSGVFSGITPEGYLQLENTGRKMVLSSGEVLRLRRQI